MSQYTSRRRPQRGTRVRQSAPHSTECSPREAAKVLGYRGGTADVTVKGRSYRAILTLSPQPDGTTRRSLSVRGPLTYPRQDRLHAMFDLTAERAIRMPPPGGSVSQQRFVAAAKEIYAAFRRAAIRRSA